VTTKTTYLGQFTWEHANAIAERLEQAQIVWWYKQSGAIARVLFRSEWGVRLFVDESRLDEAREIAKVRGDDTSGGS
jgi:hypothetical protein